MHHYRYDSKESFMAPQPYALKQQENGMFFIRDRHVTGMVRDDDGEITDSPSGPGDMFYIPKGTEHTFVLEEESKLLTMDFQPGFENYFVELGTPVSEYELPPESGPTEDKLAEIAATSERYGMEITGPPPDRSTPDKTR